MTHTTRSIVASVITLCIFFIPLMLEIVLCKIFGLMCSEKTSYGLTCSLFIALSALQARGYLKNRDKKHALLRMMGYAITIWGMFYMLKLDSNTFFHGDGQSVLGIFTSYPMCAIATIVLGVVTEIASTKTKQMKK